MVSKGFKDAGYQYINIDEGWDKGRDENGRMIVDAEKFPEGLKAVADYIHGKGLKAGIYTDLGDGKPGYIGSHGHYEEDMKTFASWGFDYIKVDINYVGDRSEANLSGLFSQVKTAIEGCGRPMVFSICSQGEGNYAGWASTTGNLWRVGKDIDYSWWGPPYQTTQWQGVLYELDHSMTHPEFARSGAWNDADMMLVGVTGGNEIRPLTLLNNQEMRSHFSLWCVLTSPLIIGADIRSISPEATSILTNAEAIAVNQDRYGQQARLVSDDNGLQVYSKVLESAASGQRAVVLLNRTSDVSEITVTKAMLGLDDKFDVRDLWEKKDLGRHESYTVKVAPHGSAFLRITAARH